MQQGSARKNRPINHYPFGSIVESRSWKGDYRYGFNGQEKDDEVASIGNSYTAEYWQYDSRLGRRWNVDPVVKEYESPYSCFSNNPIWLIDKNGADTSFSDVKTKKEFNKAYNEVNEKVDQLTKRIDKNLEKWVHKGFEKERVNRRMSRKIERLNIIRVPLVEIQESFKRVIDDPNETFHYTSRPNPFGANTTGGGISYNSEKKRFDIWFYSGNIGTLVHETRHASGYLRREWGVDKRNGNRKYYDYQDEKEGYIQKRDFLWILFRAGNNLSDELIEEEIRQKYDTEDGIRKEFIQYCESELP